jgi:cyclopropane fatty-acyl-phospholipid synthase-like methyltransferase
MPSLPMVDRVAGRRAAGPALAHHDVRAIVAYYDQCEIDYRMMWRLGTSLAIHYGHWDSTTPSLRAALERQNRLLAETVRVHEGDRVLDAGCGVGGSAIYLARQLGCRALGITLSPRQAASAYRNARARRVDDRTDFAVMDYTNTGLPDGAFDVVWALESVCYAADKASFVREAFRLLRPGGRLILADGFATRDRYAGDEQVVMDSWLNNWAVKALATPRAFDGYLRAAGFRSVTYDDVTRNIMPSSRLLYFHSLYALVVGKVAERLGLRTRVQTGNIIACRWQYPAFREGLACYGMFYAEK